MRIPALSKRGFTAAAIALLLAIFMSRPGHAQAQITWEQVGTGMYAGDIRALAFNGSGQIFGGTNGGGIFRSTDKGITWSTMKSGLISMRLVSLVLNSSGHVLAVTRRGGLFRTIAPVARRTVLRPPHSAKGARRVM